MKKTRWIQLLEACDTIKREDDILAAKDDLAQLIKEILLELRPEK